MMRALTLDEKISLKGVFARRGVSPLPCLTMEDALFYWSYLFGYKSIKFYYLY